jgi:hypothetical protein
MSGDIGGCRNGRLFCFWVDMEETFFRRPCQGDYGADVEKFRVGYGRGEIYLVQRNFF